MKTSTMVILGGAAVGVYLLLNSKTAKAKVNPGIPVKTIRPGIKFANAASAFFADPTSFVSQVNYYNNNPQAQPWDIFKLSI